MPDELLLAYPERIAPLRHVRSTLLLGAIKSLKDAGYGEAYLAALEPDVREHITGMVAGMWIPVDIALGHHHACDSLGISVESAVSLGRGIFTHTKGMLLGAAIGLAKGVGVTPKTLAPHFQRFWMRGYDGGGIRVLGTGPKEMRMLVAQCPLAGSTYYRAALRGLVTGVIELVARKAYLHELRVEDPETSVAYQAQWA